MIKFLYLSHLCVGCLSNLAQQTIALLVHVGLVVALGPPYYYRYDLGGHTCLLPVPERDAVQRRCLRGDQGLYPGGLRRPL